MNPELHTLVSEILDTARQKGMSQKELAEAAHLGEAVISRLKHADDAKFSTLLELSKSLGKKLIWVDDNSLAELVSKGELFD